MLYKTIYDSPIGKLPIFSEDDFLVALLWENENPKRIILPNNFIEKENQVLFETKQQLDEYFQGKRKIFSIPLKPKGTEFQKKVWDELLKIEFGKTKSYIQLAENLNNSKAVRAVGAANGKNPISILIPCHRVIGKNGNLTGFAGGISVKDFLLKLESNHYYLNFK